MKGWKKKLIEVSMPLEKINEASAKEKSIRHGHPSTLHLWWARRPLATARAVLFASIVDDPSEHPEKFPTPEDQDKERKRLFAIIENIVKWENSKKENIFAEALAEIKKSVGEDLPAVLDPFGGGGTIPLEAQRLGLKAYAADLNPVAVMINKAMIEIPAKFKNKPPVNPEAKKDNLPPKKPEYGDVRELKNNWHGAEGLANDILYYGKILKARAFDKLKNLYPKIDGQTVIAWIWARTVACSNPACQRHTPLVHSFQLSTKQKISVKPIVDGDKISFEICKDEKNIPEGTVSRNGARCLFCGANIPLEHIRKEGKAGRLSAQLMAVVAEGEYSRIYLPPNAEHENISKVDLPPDYPENELPEKALGFRVQEYGIKEWHQLFTNRQLTALTTFGDLIPEIRQQIIEDGGAENYADALAVYFAFLIDKLADKNSLVCSWDSSVQKIRTTFGRPAIPMAWDFVEANPFSTSSDNLINWIYEFIKETPTKKVGEVFKHSALEKFPISNVIISTDPPYYDNIGYANLSEFFYVWLRRNLKNIYPQIFGKMTFDKSEELIAEPARFDNDKEKAKNFFEAGMFQVLKNIYDAARADFPITIYYAFKQKETEIDGEASTGWETMLTSIIRAGFQITATLPMRTEMQNRMRSHESNALASSIVFACRKRPPENKFCSKNNFLNALKTELKPALATWQKTNVAPADMAQAAIGPGIAIYSRYARVADMSDTEITVRDALKMINAELAEFFGTQTGELDAASQFCVDLFTQNGFNEVKFGVADVLARAKNISVGALIEKGAVISERGEVRLIDRHEMKLYDDNKQLQKDWIEKLIAANCAWLWVQNLVIAFKTVGIEGTAELLAKYDGSKDSLKNLAYRLYSICEKHSPREASNYNELVVEWQKIFDKVPNFQNRKIEMQQGLF